MDNTEYKDQISLRLYHMACVIRLADQAEEHPEMCIDARGARLLVAEDIERLSEEIEPRGQAASGGNITRFPSGD